MNKSLAKKTKLLFRQIDLLVYDQVYTNKWAHITSSFARTFLLVLVKFLKNFANI